MSAGLELELTPRRQILLGSLAGSIVLLIPVDAWWAGLPCFGLCLWLVATDPERRLRRRLAVLLGCIALLAACDINPSLSPENFLQVGLPFTLVLLLPPLALRLWGEEEILRYRFLPRRWRRSDLAYTILSLPLAWMVLRGYEWGNRELFSDELFRHWTLGGTPDPTEIRRLFLGINLVGIWDELFFINTAFALLRSLFTFRVANAVQAVLYTAVLFDMAFTGCGVLIVFLFAWTQGAMFEKSEGLLWVLIVHLVVDYLLVAFIVQTYYPDYGLDFLWRKGF